MTDSQRERLKKILAIDIHIDRCRRKRLAAIIRATRVVREE
jgi:hypothetical protein